MGDNEEDDSGPALYAEHLRTVIQKGVMMGQLPVVTTDPNLLEEQAKKSMPKKGYNYINGGAGESATVQANRLAFRQWQIIPRVLTPTTPRDLSVTLFGRRYDTPVLMAPVGVQSWFHEDKEIGTAKACSNLGVPFTLSTSASTGIEELSNAVSGPKWFQLYWPQDEELTASILSRARDNGFHALVVTLDTWTLAWRPADLDNASVPFIIGEGDEVGFQDPVFRRKFAEMTDGDTPEESKIQAAMYWCSQMCPGITRSWDDLKILKKYWHGPILLKGILSVEDARLAVKHGMDGIVVSTHGGRQVDGCVASLEMLPEIVEAVGSQLTVMLDSGIRTGADIVKALALGAKGVFVGRPVAYGLGIAGTEGAETVLAGLLADLDLTMGLAGVQNVSEMKASMLRHVPYLGVRSNL